ncbi:GntR family transcriptional regulator [Staphylococcus hominis]|uniref:GntR family transcriptional regulator n=1 Tax=Staphylococcus hominis TaxID=1290 RepID=UPI001F569B59|nr:GntR family transcriptional regulator [Staphylococcus hominis]MCI2848422.1 GntR family transcriptional regulator [Staphylococcus hominis]MCI2850625.1 GntR family transcriptional regulator [Staphylococcus hominis]MCI2857180.1 GntR family transcriptional regulator [Staphylococcus hominis]
MIHIDNNNKNPKYKQIAECIKKDIVTGELAANQNLISIRALAENLNVSTITVKKAYKDLESKYIIVSCPRQHYKITDASLTIIQKEKKKS